MNSILKKILVPALSAVAGGAIVLAGIKFQNKSESRVDAVDLFERHKAISRQLESFMPEDLFEPRRGFGFRFDDFAKESMSTREDDEAVYYDLNVSDVAATSINTKVENGYVMITGTTEKKLEDSSGGYFTSTFNRTFPVPDRVDESKMQVTSEKDKIVVKFPKAKT